MAFDYNPFGSGSGSSSGNPLTDIRSKVLKLGVGGFLATLGIDFAAAACDPQAISGYKVSAGVVKTAVTFKNDVAWAVREYALSATKGAVDEANYVRFLLTITLDGHTGTLGATVPLRKTNIIEGLAATAVEF